MAVSSELGHFSEGAGAVRPFPVAMRGQGELPNFDLRMPIVGALAGRSFIADERD